MDQDRDQILKNTGRMEYETIKKKRTLKRISKPQLKSLGMYKLKQHKPGFDEECLGFLDQRKQDKMQWVQDTSQSSLDNLNNVRHKISRHFNNKKKEYLKDKIEELETDSKTLTVFWLGGGTISLSY
jgi:hypothetical protein